MNKYLKIFSCCHLTKGAERAAVYDMQRRQIYFLPLSLCGLIDPATNAIDIESCKTLLKDMDSKQAFEEYIEYLLDNEIGFLCDEEELKRFPAISEEFLFPANISNILIDSNSSTIDFVNDEFLKQLENLGCNYIQFRFYTTVQPYEIQRLLDILNPTQLKAIEIVMPWHDLINIDFALNFIQENRKVRNLIITAAPESRILKHEEYLGGAIILSEKKIEDNRHCGVVQLDQFALNLFHYTESLHHNTCLNRKVAIDTEGNIKNCPSMKENFGNIKETTIEQALNKPGFKKYWGITKDHITKCKDCEFRHVCTDCRAYIENPTDIYSAPLKCGYDPYSCTWQDWSINPLKESAISHYGMREIL